MTDAELDREKIPATAVERELKPFDTKTDSRTKLNR
jgi:hypothetical protein